MSDQRSNKTILGPDCRMQGDLSLDSDAVVMGQFRGSLRVAGVLEIAETAQISGTIVAGALRIAGQVEAQVIRVTQMLEVTETGRVRGTVVAGTVRLAGQAEADVVAEQGIELLAGSSLKGQLYTTAVSIVEGAAFEGDVCVGAKAMQSAGTLLRTAQEVEQGGTSGEGLEKSWDDGSEATPAFPGNGAGVRMGQGVNMMLQRRRAKVLTPAGRPGAGEGFSLRNATATPASGNGGNGAATSGESST